MPFCLLLQGMRLLLQAWEAVQGAERSPGDQLEGRLGKPFSGDLLISPPTGLSMSPAC